MCLQTVEDDGMNDLPTHCIAIILQFHDESEMENLYYYYIKLIYNNMEVTYTYLYANLRVYLQTKFYEL